MISYQWNYKPIAVNIRDGLVANGYQVWMDITHMSKATLPSLLFHEHYYLIGQKQCGSMNWTNQKQFCPFRKEV